jgi:pSer/pThr/pTyr-binding forkhead associated (FHA) protein
VEAHLELAYDGAVVAVPLWAGRLTVGRAESNNLPLKDDAVSRVHASVERIAGQYVLRDLGSSNGTLVNGERIIADRALHPDDEITVGHTRIVFRGAADDLAETLQIPVDTAVGLGDRGTLIMLCRALATAGQPDEPITRQRLAESLSESETQLEEQLERLYSQLGLDDPSARSPEGLAAEAIRQRVVGVGDLLEQPQDSAGMTGFVYVQDKLGVYRRTPLRGA